MGVQGQTVYTEQTGVCGSRNIAHKADTSALGQSSYRQTQHYAFQNPCCLVPWVVLISSRVRLHAIEESCKACNAQNMR